MEVQSHRYQAEGTGGELVSSETLHGGSGFPNPSLVLARRPRAAGGEESPVPPGPGEQGTGTRARPGWRPEPLLGPASTAELPCAPGRQSLSKEGICEVQTPRARLCGAVCLRFSSGLHPLVKLTPQSQRIQSGNSSLTLSAESFV